MNLPNKPFNEDERGLIRRMHGWMTAGAIADELNRYYSAYNEGKRTAGGVRAYISEMNGASVEVELPREIKDQLKDNGHDVAMVREQAQAAADAVVKPFIQKNPKKARA